jgi:hypothetical protein
MKPNYRTYKPSNGEIADIGAKLPDIELPSLRSTGHPSAIADIGSELPDKLQVRFQEFSALYQSNRVGMSNGQI